MTEQLLYMTIALVGVLGSLVIVPLSLLAMLKVTPSRANGS